MFCKLSITSRRFLLLLLLITGFVSVMGQRTATGAADGNRQNVLMEPVLIYDDFETEEVQSWEPYPYEEDTGYDPLFLTRKEPNSSTQSVSLCRSVRANDVAEISQGFTRQLLLVTTDETRVQTSLYFQSDRLPDKLVITICAGNGLQYTHRFAGLAANRWLTIDLPLHGFYAGNQVLTAGVQVDAVTIVGTYQHVDYLNTYHLLMDYFKLNGKRPARYDWSHPLTTRFEHFNRSVLNNYLYPGNEILFNSIAADREAWTISSAEVIPGRHTPGAKGWTLKPAGNNCKMTVPEKTIAGEWYFRYRATNKEGKLINDSIAFYILPEKKLSHPRLFFEAETLRERLNGPQSAAEQKILNKILADTSFFQVVPETIKEDTDYTRYAYTGGPFAQYYDGFQAAAKWRGPFTKLDRLIHDAAFYYSFTGNKRAADLARRAMLQLCHFSKWNNDFMLGRKLWTYFPMSNIIRMLAYGYDMVYDQLSAEERHLIRQMLMERGLRPFYRDLVEMNRMPSNITNHAAITVSACGMAALAMLRDPGADPELEMILSSIIARFADFVDKAYYEDGSYAETYDYMDMASRESVDFIAALEHIMGIDLTTTTHFRDCYKYPLQATYSNGLIQNFGDSYRLNKGFTQDHALWLVYRTGNPFLFPYVHRYLSEGNGGYLGYLWYREGIQSRFREELPVSKVFSAKGMVMRSGWSDSSAVIPIRIGPHGNHMHFDQGNFQVMLNGQELLTDPSIGEKRYYQDLEYVVYNIQAIGHNVLTVDHNPESQSPADFDIGIPALSNWPVAEQSFTGTTTDYIRAQLSSVYKGKLKSYHRSLLYTRGGLLYAIDQVESGDGLPHIYDLHYHVPYNGHAPAAKLSAGNRLNIDQSTAVMEMKLVGPLRDNSRKERISGKFSETIVSFHTAPRMSAGVVTVMYPYIPPKGTGKGTDRLMVTDRSAAGWQIVEADIPGKRERLYIRSVNAGNSVDNYQTDATILRTGTDLSGKPDSYFFIGSRLRDSTFSVSSGKPVLFAASRQQDTREWILEIKSAGATTLKLEGAANARLLEINGNKVTGKEQSLAWWSKGIPVVAGDTVIRMENLK